jgi:hypothetical protein
MDMDLLEQMQCDLASFQSGTVSVGDLGNRLLRLRDRLEFEDAVWYRALTDQIATLDSSSTFVPASASEEQVARQAVVVAVDAIKRLVDAKAAQLR